MRKWFQATAQDVRYALRILGASPLFAVSAVLTLALGIGANTAIFTLLDNLLLRPLPVHDPTRLMQVGIRGEAQDTFCFPALAEIQQRTKTLRGLFTWIGSDYSLGWGVDARTIAGANASGTVYKTLGLKAQIGRLFDESDDTDAAAPVVVISDRFWQSEFHRSPQVIGKTLLLDRHPFTIIGVTPRSFLGMYAGAAPSVTLPIHASARLHPKWDILHQKETWWLSIFGRLAPGATIAQTQAELRVISPQVLKELDPGVSGEDAKDFFSQSLYVMPAASGDGWLARRYTKPLSVLIGVSALLLLIACANLANLMLARAAARSKEMSVRLAVGASRWRLIRQLLTESLLLSFAGALLGAFFALWGTKLALRFLPLALDVSPEWRVLGYLAALAATTGILFGIAPAIRGTDVSAHEALKQGAAAVKGGRLRFASMLVALQVALSVMLLVSALLFTRTLKNLRSQNTGYQTGNLVFVDTNTERSGMSGPQQVQFYRDLLARLRAESFVSSASLIAVVPFEGGDSWYDLSRELWPNLTKEERTLHNDRVSDGYFKTAGIPILQGNDFTGNERVLNGVKPGILNALAAQTYFPNGNAVGQLLHVDDKNTYRIIGVVGNTKYASLREPAPRMIYAPAMAGDPKNNVGTGYDWFIVVRAKADAGTIGSTVRSLVRASSRDVTVGPVTPLNQFINNSLLTERILAILAAFFAALAVALVAIGLYGVLGYIVTRRTTEIGVRLALGANRREVLWLIVRQALLVTAIGVVAGCGAAIACGQLIASFLFGAAPDDLITLSATAALMFALAAIASFAPALRASRVDPATALRQE